MSQHTRDLMNSRSTSRSAQRDRDQNNDQHDTGTVRYTRPRRVPAVCRNYNTADGCERDDCERLHVCFYWASGQCRYNRRCRRHHGVADVFNQCVLSTLGWRCQEFDQAVDAMRRIYLNGGQPDSDTGSISTPQVCLEYSTAICRRQNCLRFHLCHSFVLGECDDATCCRLSHSVLDGAHNTAVAKRLPAVAAMTAQQLRTALANSLADIQVLPSICEKYNTKRGCVERQCNRLHGCRHYLAYGECRFKSDCYKSHNIDSEHNRIVLARFRMSADRALELIRAKASRADNHTTANQGQNNRLQKTLDVLKRRNELLETELLGERKLNLEHLLERLTTEDDDVDILVEERNI